MGYPKVDNYRAGVGTMLQAGQALGRGGASVGSALFNLGAGEEGAAARAARIAEAEAQKARSGYDSRTIPVATNIAGKSLDDHYASMLAPPPPGAPQATAATGAPVPAPPPMNGGPPSLPFAGQPKDPKSALMALAAMDAMGGGQGGGLPFPKGPSPAAPPSGVPGAPPPSTPGFDPRRHSGMAGAEWATSLAFKNPGAATAARRDMMGIELSEDPQAVAMDAVALGQAMTSRDALMAFQPSTRAGQMAKAKALEELGGEARTEDLRTKIRGERLGDVKDERGYREKVVEGERGYEDRVRQEKQEREDRRRTEATEDMATLASFDGLPPEELRARAATTRLKTPEGYAALLRKMGESEETVTRFLDKVGYAKDPVTGDLHEINDPATRRAGAAANKPPMTRDQFIENQRSDLKGKMDAAKQEADMYEGLVKNRPDASSKAQFEEARERLRQATDAYYQFTSETAGSEWDRRYPTPSATPRPDPGNLLGIGRKRVDFVPEEKAPAPAPAGEPSIPKDDPERIAKLAERAKEGGRAALSPEEQAELDEAIGSAPDPDSNLSMTVGAPPEAAGGAPKTWKEGNTNYSEKDGKTTITFDGWLPLSKENRKAAHEKKVFFKNNPDLTPEGRKAKYEEILSATGRYSQYRYLSPKERESMAAQEAAKDDAKIREFEEGPAKYEAEQKRLSDRKAATEASRKSALDRKAAEEAQARRERLGRAAEFLAGR